MTSYQEHFTILHDNNYSHFHRRVNFDIIFTAQSGSNLRQLNSFDEGVEFGFQNLDHGREWIPLAFYSFQQTNIHDEDFKIAPELMFNATIVTTMHVSIFYRAHVHGAELKLCGSEIMQNNATLSFRWLQTVRSGRSANADEVYLDNIRISMNTTVTQECVLFNDYCYK